MSSALDLNLGVLWCQGSKSGSGLLAWLHLHSLDLHREVKYEFILIYFKQHWASSTFDLSFKSTFWNVCTYVSTILIETTSFST